MDEPTHAFNYDALSVSMHGDSVFEPGQIVGGKYRIVSILGRGGMGTVYRVEQVFLNKDFALKTVDKRQVSDISVRRFQLEAKAASLLDHPNLVQVHDFGLLENGQPFLVMDLVEGISLAEHLRENGPLTVEQAARLFTQACFGLLYAHEQGVIHRDIKPSNLMLTKDAAAGTEGSVKVVDFGIAKITNTEDGEIQALTRTGEIFGSPLYMSPEQCSGGKIDLRSDIYSLGCVLFEALTGAPPHLGNNALATMMLHQSEKALPLKEASLGRIFPERLELIVARMLQKPPAERYQNLGIVAHQLASICSDSAPVEIRAPRPVKEKLPRTISLTVQHLSLLLLATSLTSAVISAEAVMYLTKSQTKPQSDAPASDSARKTRIANKDIADADNGFLDNFADLKMERFSSASSIRRVIEADAGHTRTLVFPACGIGSLWTSEKGILSSLPVGQAKGTISIPSDIPLTLEVNDQVIKNPALLENIAPDAFFGLAFRDCSKATSDRTAEDGMKKILKLAAGWRGLQSIMFNGQVADDEVLEALNNLKDLRYLDIRVAKDMNPTVLARQPFLGRLTGLYVNQTSVDSILPKLAGSDNLQYLFLTNTAVSADVLMELRHCPRLEYLALIDSKRRRTDEPIFDAILQLKNLKSAAFFRLNAEQIKRLQRCPWLTAVCLCSQVYSPQEQALIKSHDARINFAN